MNDRKILEMAGFEEEDENHFVLIGDYELAKKYMECDADNTRFLEFLLYQEKNNLVFHSHINTKEKWTYYNIGNNCETSEHLEQLGNGIDNTSNQDDDYDGVIEFAKECIIKNRTVIFSGLYEIVSIGNSLGVRLESNQLKNNGLSKRDTIFLSARFG